MTISLAGTDAGEAAAIQIAAVEVDSLLLIDDAAGRAVATRLGIANTGTLGVLLAAAREGLNFRISRSLIDRLLA